MIAVIISSMLIGAILAIVAQVFLLKKWFLSLPVTEPPRRPQYDQFNLPQVRYCYANIVPYLIYRIRSNQRTMRSGNLIAS